MGKEYPSFLPARKTIGNFSAISSIIGIVQLISVPVSLRTGASITVGTVVATLAKSVGDSVATLAKSVGNAVAKLAKSVDVCRRIPTLLASVATTVIDATPLKEIDDDAVRDEAAFFRQSNSAIRRFFEESSGQMFVPGIRFQVAEFVTGLPLEGSGINSLAAAQSKDNQFASTVFRCEIFGFGDG